MQIDTFGTLVAASLVLLLGQWLVTRIGLLRAYTIPEPVAGGLIVALALTALRGVSGVEVRFDTAMQTPLMLAFFASIGLNAKLSSLKSGGPLLVRFLLVVLGLLILQDAIGIGLAKAIGLDPLLGLLAGSVTLSGGHGTGAAWSKVFSERHGLQSATEVAIACATFGLVLGGLLGGPIAKLLVRNLATPGTTAPHAPHAPQADAAGDTGGFEHPKEQQSMTPSAFINTLALFAIALSGGTAIESLIRGTAFELPTFVCVLFVGVLLSNGLALLGWRVSEHAVALLGNVSLSLFLAMALMTLRLWELASLALPMLVLLGAQVLMMVFYAILVTFRLMGRNYDAAVLAAGHCGFGLGATPTAIANMQAVTARFGQSHMAFLIVPMVSAFFIDIANAIVIKLFLALPIYG
ncbi:sodium:glutamate symporter [Burkholderia ubonensis]|uniref:Sodium/glutamate symporter n=1 Tax=Burkholderia ubonensis TaxID=101571 RepID=A0AB73FZC6_9BURK|nr:sodium/glutamate symporter [Burkholderia ubonensis]KVK78171.1 sodium:glutamate symporter [Burkholderia ubonensis]KVL61858.1 sodium:glutamate symporter [Burkholderia ubonensis]KVM28637.1 sodium:glutamate symporter [Burkholderia ubonensis]KVM35148.1 sodium:glutamate symporter [Burkholderia ubonensis]